jgi:hypothetical protein
MIARLAFLVSILQFALGSFAQNPGFDSSDTSAEHSGRTWRPSLNVAGLSQGCAK